MIFTPADELDLKAAVRLACHIFEKPMGKRFPVLFDKANKNHVFVAKDNDAVVAMAAYLPGKITYGNTVITVASLGSVCTKKSYRGKNVATRLLQMAEAKMTDKATELMIISGDGPLYDRFGATRFGNDFGCKFDALDVSGEHTDIKNGSVEDIDVLMELYEKETPRFIRSKPMFKQLLRGQMHPIAEDKFPLDIICVNGVPKAYLQSESKADEEYMLVEEFAGDRKVLAETFPGVAKKHGKKGVVVPFDAHDAMRREISADTCRRIDQHASIKMLRPVSFIEKMNQLFITEGLLPVRFREKNETFLFETRKKAITFTDYQDVHRFVFGNVEAKFYPGWEEYFPIPFVWTNNLNYV